jgi:hypothetical protein
MATDLLFPKLAFRALSDDPEGDDDGTGVAASPDEELDGDDDADGEEDLGNAGFTIEEGDETAE